MQILKRIFWIYLLVLTVLWGLVAQPSWSILDPFFQGRSLWLQLSGVLGIGVMSLAMVLAARPDMVEPELGGFERVNQLRDWLAIAGLALSCAHWLIAGVAQWLVGLGLAEGVPPALPAELPEDSVQHFLLQQQPLAASIGAWVFYAALLGLVLLLIKRLPRRGLGNHIQRLLALAYLALVWHALVLLQFDDWSSGLGLVMAVVMGLGSVAAVLVLIGRGGTAQRPSVGRLIDCVRSDPPEGLTLVVEIEGQWTGYAPGQLVLATLSPDDIPQPFTIASAWHGDRLSRLIVKSLGGDSSAQGAPVECLPAGTLLKLEGPLGRFDFQGQPRQIWVGGDIGIIPFVNRLQAMGSTPDGTTIDLFHTTSTYDATAIERLRRQAEAANVRLHVLWDACDGQLDAQRIARLVPDWREADVWYCGPADLGQDLEQGLRDLGLPRTRFHQELFVPR